MAKRDKPRHEAKKPKKNKGTDKHGGSAPKSPVGGILHS